MKLLQMYEGSICEEFILSSEEEAVYNSIAQIIQYCKEKKLRAYVMREIKELKDDITAEIADKLDKKYPSKRHPDLDLEDIIVIEE